MRDRSQRGQVFDQAPTLLAVAKLLQPHWVLAAPIRVLAVGAWNVDLIGFAENSSSCAQTIFL
jgi:hypothetical protein